MKAALILATQLLRDHPAINDPSVDVFVMIEAEDACRKLPYHQHKLVLLLAGMRAYHMYLESLSKKVIYRNVDETKEFGAALRSILDEESIDHISWMRASDVPTQERLEKLVQGVEREIYPNDLFITPEGELRAWFEGRKSPLMETFYRWQRQRTGILMDGVQPEGGVWNYDAENRKPLPKAGIDVPPLLSIEHSEHTKDVIETVARLFPDHPGSASGFWLPVDHTQADVWLDDFFRRRFAHFGIYEDAMKAGEPFLFHGVLSPLINIGLLTVRQVIDGALAAYRRGDAPLSGVEGFIRQIIGWREYMYGLYLARPDMKELNFFGFTKPLEDWWYSDDWKDQDLPLPVQSALETVHRYGYNHHIERLMVLGNWFLLNEYDPAEVYRWFSAMYVDAYQWVMVPNVMGMSQFADGGYTATKPYISGGNYLEKMGRWWGSTAAARDSEFTRLYWRFLNRQHDHLKGNHRMALVLKQARVRRDAQ